MIQIGIIVFAIIVFFAGAAWVEGLVAFKAKATAALTQCATDKKNMVAAINEQNLAVDALKALEAKREADAAAEVAKAQANATWHRKRADEYLVRIPKGDVCVATRDMLAEYAAERQAKKP